MTPTEVATLFGVDPKTVTRWSKRGKLSFTWTLGGHRRFYRDEVERLFTGQHQARVE
jgi:excisionase family DNA binding protein